VCAYLPILEAGDVGETLTLRGGIPLLATPLLDLAYIGGDCRSFRREGERGVNQQTDDHLSQFGAGTILFTTKDSSTGTPKG